MWRRQDLAHCQPIIDYVKLVPAAHLSRPHICINMGARHVRHLEPLVVMFAVARCLFARAPATRCAPVALVIVFWNPFRRPAASSDRSRPAALQQCGPPPPPPLLVTNEPDHYRHAGLLGGGGARQADLRIPGTRAAQLMPSVRRAAHLVAVYTSNRTRAGARYTRAELLNRNTCRAGGAPCSPLISGRRRASTRARLERSLLHQMRRPI